jgi:type 1 fimbria pilin
MKNDYLKAKFFKILGFCISGILISFTLSGLSAGVNSVVQDDDDDKYNKGVTVSPSHIKFNVDLGKMATKKVKITNYTGSVQKFRIKYNDFDISVDGFSSFLDAGTSKYSLSKLINIAPTFVELEPGTSAEISVTVQVPNNPESNKAAWGILLIEQAEEKKVLDPGNTSGETIAFGITPTYAFGVWIYQNPPNVEMMSVDINKFSYEKTKDNLRLLTLNVENKGDGIAFCRAYSELTNIKTGEQQSLGGKNYTILPGYRRIFIFELPADIPKGTYSAVGVIDYDSEEEIVAAELEITID